MTLSFEALILAIGLTSVIAIFVLLPMFERSSDQPQHRAAPRGTLRQNQALETLWTEKMRVLRALRDLDFDYDLGKLPDSAYQDQRFQLIRLAVAITKRIDELEAMIAEQESRLEEAVAAFRQRIAQ
jgi:hypothetical protein